MKEKMEIFEKMKENNEKLINEYVLFIQFQVDTFRH